MADIADVEQAIVNLITPLVYPNGSSIASAINSDNGPMPVRIYRGWPIPDTLDADLAPATNVYGRTTRSGTMNISVFSRGATEHNTTRYLGIVYQTLGVISTPTITAVLDPTTNKITIGGQGSTAFTQYVTVLIGQHVSVSYAVQGSDTAAVVVAALASLITATGITASVSGLVITANTSAYLVVEVGVSATQGTELRRQRSQVQITLWCPSPLSRDNAARLIEPTLANTPFLTLADGTAARFRYHNTLVVDQPEKVMLYRRDLLYDCEYLTLATDTAYQVTTITPDVRGSELDLGQAPHNQCVVPWAPTPVTVPPPQTPLVAQP